MAALSSISSNPEDFYCPICMDIFQTPVSLSECHHTFCRKCILRAIKSVGPHCPLCRGPITRKETTFPKRSMEKEEAMKKHLTKCKSCGKLKKYYIMRRHYKTCSLKYKVLCNNIGSRDL
ncbi:E3 ubiquitin-protein ligase RNF138-like isoform 3-T3 [Anomaloglossus baeobatrachus]|uniref:E3 ubiquitin-protein ligase RNF138-like isoform X3 n=1 Tax=Anomaloglossus baeobatrachus TaxID=238106 RepID=UPI003F50119F